MADAVPNVGGGGGDGGQSRLLSRPFPTPDEMPRQLRPPALAALGARQFVGTLEGTRRYTPLPPHVAAARGHGTPGWHADRHGVASSTVVTKLVGFATFSELRDVATNPNQNEYGVMVRARATLLADARSAPPAAPPDAPPGLAGDALDDFRERTGFGSAHERDALLSLLMGMPGLRARESTFVAMAPVRSIDGEPSLLRIGASPDAVARIDRAGKAARFYAVEFKTVYGSREPTLWSPSPSVIKGLAKHVVQLFCHMAALQVDRGLLVCWSGEGARVFSVKFEPLLWARLVVFLRNFVLYAPEPGAPPAYEAADARAFDLEARALRAAFETIALATMKIVPTRVTRRDDSWSFRWPACYTYATVADGPAPSFPRYTGRVREPRWTPISAAESAAALAGADYELGSRTAAAVDYDVRGHRLPRSGASVAMRDYFATFSFALDAAGAKLTAAQSNAARDAWQAAKAAPVVPRAPAPAPAPASAPEPIVLVAPNEPVPEWQPAPAATAASGKRQRGGARADAIDVDADDADDPIEEVDDGGHVVLSAAERAAGWRSAKERRRAPSTLDAECAVCGARARMRSAAAGVAVCSNACWREWNDVQW